jgi:cytochrome c-type biogenesis protein CcmH/NrfG
LIFLWRARALTWRVVRPWSTGILAAIAVLAAGYVSLALWRQHDSKEHTSLTSKRTASS